LFGQLLGNLLAMAAQFALATPIRQFRIFARNSAPRLVRNSVTARPEHSAA